MAKRNARGREQRDWPHIINRLNGTKSGRISVRMGTPGAAQVTRCRLESEYNGLYTWTRGPVVHMSLYAGDVPPPQ